MAINFDHQRDRISTNSGVLTVNTSGALSVPIGTIAQRPATSTGQIRFNTDLQSFEGYNGVAWSTLGGVIDTDRNTYIIAETAPGVNNNDLDFYTDGVQRLQIDEEGDFRFGDNLDKFVIDFLTGDITMAGTLGISGQATFASANVEDLTAGRVVLAGVDGELEDNANLTFDGTTLTVTGNIDVTGNVTIGGNITIGDADTDAITVDADFNSNLIPDLDRTYNLGATNKNWQTLFVDTLDSDDEVITISTTGALTLPVGTTLQRPTAVTGMIRYNTDDLRFEAYDGTAWTGVGGVVDVDQNTYITAETSPGADNNDLDFYTAGVQRLQINQDGDFLYGDNLDKFTIDWATGQTTLTSASVQDLTSGRVVLAGIDGELEDSANLTFDGSTLTVTGDIDVTGNVTIGGNITIGDADTDAITVSADFDSNLIPDLDDTYDLGSSTKNWQNVYVNTITNNDDRLTVSLSIVDIDGTGAIIVPVGTTIERPTAEQGMIRYNTTDSRFEAYNGVAWTGLGGVIDVDQNTYIIAETSPGANNNDLDFYTDGVHRLQIDENGDFLLGDSLNKFTVDFDTGNTFIQGTLQVDGAVTLNNTLDVVGESTLASAIVSDLTEARIVIVGTDGALIDSEDFRYTGFDFTIGTSGAEVFNVNVATGDTTIAGDTTLGDTNSNVVTFNADVNSNIIPNANETHDLGTTTDRWRALYARDVVITDSIVIGTGNSGSNLDVEGQSTFDSVNVEDLTDNRVVIAGADGELEDSADLTFDGTDLNVGQGNFTVDVASGSIYTTGTLETDGLATLNTAVVENLTDNRIVIAGATSNLEDDANLTFDGTAFKVGTDTTDKFTVDVATGNTAILGTLDVDGETTLSSAIIEDLTDNRVLIAGTDGAVEDDANFTFDGTTFNLGATSEFTVDVATGNTAILGTLDVDGQTSLSSVNVEDLTSGRVVLAGTDGELEDSADLTFDGTLLTVTGNQTVTGDLTINGNIDVDTQATFASVNIEDLTPNRIVLAGLAGELQDSANLTFDGSSFDISSVFGVNVATGNTSILGVLTVSSDTAISGDFSIAGTKFTVDNLTGNTITEGTLQVDGNADLNADLTVDGNTILGSSATNTVTFNADISSSIIPSADATYDLGAVGAEWVNIYAGNIVLSGDSDVTGNQTVSGDLDVGGQTTLASASVTDLTQDRIVIAGVDGELEDDANFRFDGTDFMVGATGSETFSVNVTTGNTELSGNLLVSGDLTVDGTVTTVNSTTVTIDDPVFTLGGDTTPTINDNLDRGIEFRYFDTSAKVGFFGYDESSGAFTFIPDAINTNEVFSGNAGDVIFGEGEFTGISSGNIQIGVTDNNTIDTTSGNLTIDSADGLVIVNDDLTVTGALITASATVNNLTDNRIVLAGPSGSLEDNANLTFDGTTFAIAATNFTVDVSTGNVSAQGNSTIAGTLNVDSQSTLASVNVEDLTDNRIVLVGVGGELEDDVNFTFDGTTFDIGTGNFSVNSVSGNTSIAGSLSAGESTLSSATVSDLTDNRIVLAGTSGALEDDANLTFDGTTFTVIADTNITGAVVISGDLTVDNININDNTISSTNINGNLSITPNGTGEVIISTVTVSDLTDDRIVIAGTSGALEDDANFRFDGTDFRIGASGNETFSVNVATGDTTIAGELAVTGNISGATFSSSTLTNDRVVIVGTGGELEDTADFTFNGTALNVGQGNFTVEVANGDTNVNGDLTVGEAVNIGSAIGATSTSTGALTVVGGAGIGENLYVGGNVVIDGTLGADGGVTLGDNILSDTLTLNAKITGSLIPTANDTYSLGSTGEVWRDLFLSESITFEGASTENEIVLPTNLADALSITESSGDLIVFTTTSGARLITIYPNTVIEGTLTVGTSGGTTSIDEILDEDNMVSDSDTALATQQSIKAYVDTVEANVAMEFQGDTGAEGSVNLRTEVFNILGTANEIETSSASQTLTIGLPDDVTIGNNLTVTTDLTVSGTNAILAVDNFSVDDPIITVGGTTAPISNDTLDKGVEFRWYTGGAAKTGFFGYDESAGTFTFIPDATNTSEVISGTAGNVVFGDGTFTGISAGNLQVGLANDNTITTSTGNLTLDSATGTTTIDDNLSVTGEATILSAVISDLTDNRIVIAGTGGALEDDGNFRYDSNNFMIGTSGSEKFNVSVATGNTNISGTLTVGSSTELNSNVSLGASAADNIIVTGSIASNLIPDSTDSRDLGSSANGWRDLYITESINFIGGSSENEIIIPTNIADGLSIKDSAGDLIVVTTTTGSQLVTIVPDLQLSGSFTINGGSTVTSILDEDTMTSDSDVALATQQSIKAYVDNSVSDVDLNFTGDSGTGSVNLLTENFVLNGTANEIETTASGQIISIGLPNDVTVSNDLSVGNDVVITGNLTVNGTTTTVNTTELVVEDNLITLNQGETGAGVTEGSAGIEVDRGTETNVSFIWDETTDRWTTGTDDLQAGEFYGTIDGGTF